VFLKQGNEVLSVEALRRLADNINRAQISWRAEVHRPFVGKTRNEMLKISGGNRYSQALVLRGDIALSKSSDLRMILKAIMTQEVPPRLPWHYRTVC
jgi:hypothetical protein